LDVGEGLAERLGDEVVGGESSHAVGRQTEHPEVEGPEIERTCLAAAGEKGKEDAPKETDQRQVGCPLTGLVALLPALGHRVLLSLDSPTGHSQNVCLSRFSAAVIPDTPAQPCILKERMFYATIPNHSMVVCLSRFVGRVR
jgi:hypothetical protein